MTNRNNTQLTDFIVQPHEQLTGSIQCPGDKSISHRAVILSSLAKGRSVISGFLQSEDCLATLKVMQQLGVPIEINQTEQAVIIDGVGLYGLKPSQPPLNCGNSGTGMRLLAGILAAQSFESELTGDQSLQKRPMQRIVDPLIRMGANIKTTNGSAPLFLSPVKNGLKGIHYDVPMASAQVQSSILLAGLYASGETSVTVPGIVRDHSVNVLSAVGVDIKQNGLTVSLTSPQYLNPMEMSVPGDLSSAAFFIVGSLIAKRSDVIIKHVGINPTRTGVIHILRAMGANLNIQNEQIVSGERVADLHVKSSQLRGVNILKSWVDLAIDELPIVLVAASCAEGQTILRDAKELRVKESDRLLAMFRGLQTLGVDLTLLDDGMIINGKSNQVFKGGVINSFDDHRIAMSFAISALRANAPIHIKQCQNVATSFPTFIDCAKQLQLSIEAAPKYE